VWRRFLGRRRRWFCVGEGGYDDGGAGGEGAHRLIGDFSGGFVTEAASRAGRWAPGWAGWVVGLEGSERRGRRVRLVTFALPAWLLRWEFLLALRGRRQMCCGGRACMRVVQPARCRALMDFFSPFIFINITRLMFYCFFLC
jgi:hypothetical protein